MNVFIEQLNLPIEEDWRCFLSSEQSSYLIQPPFTDPGQEASLLAWGVTIDKEIAGIEHFKCGMLVGKLIKSIEEMFCIS